MTVRVPSLGKIDLFVCLFGYCGISTFEGYLMPHPFLYKLTVLFQTI